MTAAQSVTATFSADSATSYSLVVTKVGTGTVTSAPVGISCGTSCNKSYAVNTAVTLAAAPAAGWQFAGWSGACTGTGTCSVTMNAAKSVTATFKPKLTVSKVGSGAVTSSPAGINCGVTCAAYFPYKGTVTLTAIPASGQKLKSWAGCTTASGNTCTVSMTATKTVTTTFGL